MASPKKTIATFSVKINIPKGSNCHAMQMYLREAIELYQAHRREQDAMTDITADSFTVSLQKMEKVYG